MGAKRLADGDQAQAVREGLQGKGAMAGLELPADIRNGTLTLTSFQDCRQPWCLDPASGVLTP